MLDLVVSLWQNILHPNPAMQIVYAIMLVWAMIMTAAILDFNG